MREWTRDGRVELSKPPNFFPDKSRDLAWLDLVRRLPMYCYHTAHYFPRVVSGTGTLPRHHNSPVDHLAVDVIISWQKVT